jgi:hypothetical protein
MLWRGVSTFRKGCPPASHQLQRPLLSAVDRGVVGCNSRPVGRVSTTDDRGTVGGQGVKLRRDPVRRVALVGLVIAVVAIGGPRVRNASTFYVLDEESAWLEGCIVGVCLCPVALLDDLTGSFELAELPTLQPGPWRSFEVRNLRWRLGRGDQVVEIRGTGLYQTAAPVLDEQRLILDLTFDGDPVEQIDSGVVAGGLAFPSIEIQALTPGRCYQEGVSLAAEPVVRRRSGSRPRR